MYLAVFSPFGLAQTPGKEGALISVGPNVQVSKALPNGEHYETLLAADPNNRNNLLGASMVFSEETNKYSIVAYKTTDSGTSWSTSLVASENSYQSDPAIAYGTDGTIYIVYGAPDEKFNYLTYIYRSKDSGKTWLPRTALPKGSFDRFYFAVDDTGGKFNGRVYVQGVGVAGSIDKLRRTSLKVYRSSDGGETFNGPAQLISENDNWIFGNGPCVVMSEGTLVCLFGEIRNITTRGFGLEEVDRRPSRPNAVMKIITSNDGGETFSKASVISEFVLRTTAHISNQPYLAVDRGSGPFKDSLYATYTDCRTGSCNIMLSYSRDKGQSWSKPHVINDERTPLSLENGPDHHMPVVAVNREGVVGVSWYDRRDSADNFEWKVRFTASLDGGETFLPSVQVSEVGFRHNQEGEKWVAQAQAAGGGHIYSNNAFNSGPLSLEVGSSLWRLKGGDTAGMAADAGGIFHPFWVDNRTGISQVWAATVSVAGKSLCNGSPELSDLSDVSNSVIVNYTKTSFDRATGTCSLDAQLENVSNDAIIGPIKARVILVRSDLGVPSILSSDNGEPGLGAVFDFTPLLTNNRLEPRQKLKTKRLQFKLTDLRPIDSLRPSPDWGLLQFIRIEFKVLGKLEKPK